MHKNTPQASSYGFVRIQQNYIGEKSRSCMDPLDFTLFLAQCKNPEIDQNSLKIAFEFGKERHEGQLRKISGLPYYTHPIRVALALSHLEQDLIIAGLLHDVLEDTDTAAEEIEQKFGHKVYNLVLGMTKNKVTKDIFGPLEEASRKDPRIYLVKLADRLDNLMDNILEMSSSTQKKYLDETPILLEMAAQYGMTLFHSQIERELDLLRENNPSPT